MNYNFFRMKYNLILLILLISINIESSTKNDFNDSWVFNQLDQMNLDEKVGQLFIIRAQSNWGKRDLDYLETLIKKYKVGGIAFFKGSAKKQLELTRKYQKLTKIPLFIAMDSEWGLGMRLNDAISYPQQLTLGAIKNNRLIYEMGYEIGEQLNRIGVNFSYSPVVDINNNRNNPIINDRSFGDDKKNVASKGYAYMKGLQSKNIISCIKHFPGHGYADVDSHKDLPVLDLSKNRLWDIELFPFKMLIQQGVKAIMTAHLHIPSIDNRKNRPTSLSTNAVKGVLRDSLRYKGLIVTDALAMKGVSKYFSSGEAVVEAFLAGNDILELPSKFIEAFNAIKKAVETGKISKERLNASVIRILTAKYNIGLYDSPELKKENIVKDLNKNKYLALKENLYRNAITFLGNVKSNVPLLPEQYSKKIAIVSIGFDQKTKFQKRFDTYLDSKQFNIPNKISKKDIAAYLNKLKGYDKVIVGLHNYKKSINSGFGISKNELELIKKLNKRKNMILAVFGTPYVLQLFDKSFSIVLAYENDPMAQDVAAQAILGVFDVSGKLPVTASENFKSGDGIDIKKSYVMGYSIPEYVGLNSDSLDIKIGRIVAEMFDSAAAPGCQILVAKDGNIVFDKCYGYWTYEKKRKVKHTDIYGLASVTKVMATTLSMMKLQDEKKLSVFNKFSDYLDGEIDTSNKKDVVIMDAMAHHAGLKPWIPAYQQTLDTINGVAVPSKRYYRKSKQGNFTVKIADNMYLRKDYQDTLWSLLLKSPMLKERKYKYSDLGLIMTKEVVEKVSGQTEDKYVQDNFYHPMGLKRTTYNPWKKFPKTTIAPAEKDEYWRHQVVQGYVHDMWSAMLGGVSGHAGLFSTSRDLARLLQMILNRGKYGGKTFFSYPTIYSFTTRFKNSTRRGIGWDMKELDRNKDCNISELASTGTFGHYGFTGTGIWADPEKNIVYIFLSNRTYPTMKNRKMYKYNFRSKIQSSIYESLIK